MKKRLKRIYWRGIAITMTMAAMITAAFVLMTIRDAQETMRVILSTATAWTETSDATLQELARDIAQAAPPMRVTFLMEQGLVLADSEADPLLMQSHVDRWEVVQAMQGGIGESMRLSETTRVPTLYAAIKISPQLVLRLSYPLSDIMRFLLFCSLGILLVFLLLHLIFRRFVSSFAGEMEGQLEDVAVLLAQDGQAPREARFPELAPALRSIAYQVNRLNADMREVRRTLGLREDFVANASHELKSPLTSIRGFAELLNEGMADDPQEQALYTSLILKECDRMLSVIQDILLLSQAQREDDGQREPVNVRQVAEEIFRAVEGRARKRNLHLALQGECTLLAREKDVWEILYNLVDNAIRYGKDGGFVRIVLDPHGFSVSDDGMGMDAEHLPHLFEPFYRADKAHSRDTGGTGLGLSIVRRLVEKHGGSITVESAPNRGTRFDLRFERQD